MSPTTSTETQQHNSPATSSAMAAQSEAAKDERMLSFEVLTSKNDKADALRLIIDSVAQQRQVASRALIFHPICFSVLAAVVSLIHINLPLARRDFGSMMVTYSGVLITYFLAVRYTTGAYIRIAEETDWTNWLAGDDNTEQLVLGARFGSEIVTALVLQVPKRKNNRSKATMGKNAVIRAWTTKLRYRRHGLGGDMLREAIKLSKITLGPDCTVEFAEDHANSELLPLPETFNATFARRDKRAREELHEALEELEAAEKPQQ